MVKFIETPTLHRPVSNITKKPSMMNHATDPNSSPPHYSSSLTNPLMTRVVCGQVWAAAQSRQRGLHTITQSWPEPDRILRSFFVFSPLSLMLLFSKFHCGFFLALWHLLDLYVFFHIFISIPIFFKKTNRKKTNSHFAGIKYAYTESALEPLCQICKSKFKIRNFIAWFLPEQNWFLQWKKYIKIRITWIFHPYEPKIILSCNEWVVGQTRLPPPKPCFWLTQEKRFDMQVPPCGRGRFAPSQSHQRASHQGDLC
jgi:hypothetical protein